MSVRLGAHAEQKSMELNYYKHEYCDIIGKLLCGACFKFFKHTSDSLPTCVS